MFIGTHACIPIIAIGSADVHRLQNNKLPLLKNTHFFLVVIAGILPDILWPHSSMHARLTSWTHTIWFMAISLLIIFFISKKILKKEYKIFALFFWSAIVVHIFTDLISGGVALLYPIEKVFGDYYIPWRLWVYSDLMFATISTVLLVIRHKLIIK